MRPTERVRVSRLDVAELLADDETRAEYLRMSLDEEGIAGLLDAIAVVARSKAMRRAAEGAGHGGGDDQYSALAAAADPTFKAVASMLTSLGCKLDIRLQRPPFRPRGRERLREAAKTC